MRLPEFPVGAITCLLGCCLLFSRLAIGDQPASRDAQFRSEVEAPFPRLVETRHELHRHPEQSNQEERTART